MFSIAIATILTLANALTASRVASACADGVRLERLMFQSEATGHPGLPGRVNSERAKVDPSHLPPQRVHGNIHP